MKSQSLKTAILAITALVATFSHATQIRFCDTPTPTCSISSPGFVAKGQIGNSVNCNTPCTKEQLLTGGGATTSKENTWKNGIPKGFELAYTASTRTVKFTLDCNVLSYTLTPGKKLCDLVIKTQSTFCGASVKLNGMSFNNNTIEPVISTNRQVSSFRIVSPNLEQDWNLKGNATMAWAGNTRPGCSDLNFTVSGAECVPEPASMSALVLGGLGLLKRKRNSK